MSQPTSRLASWLRGSTPGQHRHGQMHGQYNGNDGQETTERPIEQADQRADDQQLKSGEADTSWRLRLSTLFHAVGVALSGSVLLLGTVYNPGVGFPIAVGVLSLLGIVGTPPASAPTAVLQTIRGGILTGGMKQGVLIKALFGAALFHRGLAVSLLGDGAVDVPSLLLGSALFSTAIGTALAASAVTAHLSVREQDASRSMP